MYNCTKMEMFFHLGHMIRHVVTSDLHDIHVGNKSLCFPQNHVTMWAALAIRSHMIIDKVNQIDFAVGTAADTRRSYTITSLVIHAYVSGRINMAQYFVCDCATSWGEELGHPAYQRVNPTVPAPTDTPFPKHMISHLPTPMSSLACYHPHLFYPNHEIC